MVEQLIHHIRLLGLYTFPPSHLILYHLWYSNTRVSLMDAALTVNCCPDRKLLPWPWIAALTVNWCPAMNWCPDRELLPWPWIAVLAANCCPNRKLLLDRELLPWMWTATLTVNSHPTLGNTNDKIHEMWQLSKRCSSSRQKLFPIFHKFKLARDSTRVPGNGIFLAVPRTCGFSTGKPVLFITDMLPRYVTAKCHLFCPSLNTLSSITMYCIV